ncbi:putative la domain family [Diaporthe ampelina]|uniref:Putative la domain family n=1 Tax=Diaporthe ampelina TaxID=1214573 RepID=A0A0G2FCF3_9PEZI|nr:putative la domain family [Diaporthe ampelina]
MSAATTFSYAQAAKGRNTAHPDLQSAASSSPVDPAKDDNSSVTTAADASAKTFSTTSEVSESVKSSEVDLESVASKAHSEVANTGDSDGSAISAKSESTLVARPDEAPKTNAQSTTSEKNSRALNRPSESSDSRKGRKNKKGKNSDKDAEGDQVQQEQEKEVVPVKLFEAPPPTVNVWQQRAAAAKARQPSVTPAPAGSDAPTKTVSQHSNKSISSAEGVDKKDSSETVRPGKAADGSRPSNEQAPRRNPRGSRASDQVTNGNVPPVQDASLWPTPDTAAAEDSKRKVSESDAPSKDKQEEGSQTKSTRPKYVQKLEINHSVKWETQLQTRPASKGRGGGQSGRNSVGRGGHVSSASVSGDKLQGVSEAQGPAATGDSQGKPREDAPPRTNSLPFEKKKFSADTRDIRKTSASAERRAGASGEYQSTSKSEAAKGSKGEFAQGFGGQQGGSRGEGAEPGRKEGGFTGHKDARPRRGAHGNGRGGHSGSQSYSQTYQGNGHGPRSSTYNPPPFTNGYSYGGPGSGRAGRGRPASINGYKGPSNGAVKMPMQPLNTDFGPFSPYGQAPYSALPGGFPPSDYSLLVHNALKAQIEYYFSPTNLPKDVFLRENMDSQGFVPLEVIADFSRVRSISQQNLQYVREACMDSEEIEFVLGDGKTELLRRREGWQMYVLPEATRREHARNPGPTNFQSKSRHTMPMNTPGFHQQGSMPFPYPTISSPAYGGPFPNDMYPGYLNGPGYNNQGANGRPVNGHPRPDDSQLNAAVPEFAPGSDATFNGFTTAARPAQAPWVDDALRRATTFSDEEVAKLHVVLPGQPKQSEEAGKLPNGDTHDGTVDTKGAETNGIHASPDALNTPELGPVTDEAASSSPPYFRFDGSLAQSSGDKITERYVDVRARALELRQSAAPGEVPDDMRRLYKFWAPFLVTKFNPSMYRDFRQLALEDATSETPSKTGLGYLLQFYTNVLSKSGTAPWGPEHPIYGVLQSDFHSSQTMTGSAQPQV